MSVPLSVRRSADIPLFVAVCHYQYNVLLKRLYLQHRPINLPLVLFPFMRRVRLVIAIVVV